MTLRAIQYSFLLWALVGPRADGQDPQPQQVDALYCAVATPRAVFVHYTSGARVKIPNTDKAKSIAFAPGNEALLMTTDAALWSVGLDGSGRRLLSSGWKHVDGVAVSPDGLATAFCGYTHEAGWAIYTLRGHNANPEYVTSGRLPAWMSDSRTLLFENYTAESAQIYRFDPDDRSVHRMSYDPDGTITTAVDVAVSPDGAVVAFWSDGLRVKDVASGRVKMLTTPEHYDNRPVFSADGKEMLFLRQDRDPVGRRVDPRIMRIEVHSGRTELVHESPAFDAAYPHPKGLAPSGAGVPPTATSP